MRSGARSLLAGLLLSAAAACVSDPPPSASAKAAPAARPPAGPIDAAAVDPASALPAALEGFTAGPLVAEPGWVRREYVRGQARISLTIAHFGGSAEGYDQWTKASAGYPAAALDVPPGAGSGFYECTGPGTGGTCSLHIQLKPGWHVEVMSAATATRADLDDLLRAVPLRRLAGG